MVKSVNSFKREMKNKLQSEFEQEEASTFTKYEIALVMHKLNNDKQPRYWLPKVLSGLATVACLFIILTIILTDNESSTNSSPKEMKPIEQAEDVEETESTEVSFYEDLNLGDSFNDWMLQSKDANMAVFTGEETIRGRSYNEDYQWYFEVDETSIEQLPFLKDTKPILTIEKESDQETVVKFEKGSPNTITVQQLVVTLEDGEPTYLASHFTIENIREVHTSVNELDEKLLSIYEQLFNDTSNIELLKGLSPTDILTLYLYAEIQQDYKKQYSLFNHDESIEKPFSSVDEYVQAASNKRNNIVLETFTSQMLLEVISDEHSAYITMFEPNSDGISFGFNKTKEGTWAVNWMPIQ